jgi:hypothetical protein
MRIPVLAIALTLAGAATLTAQHAPSGAGCCPADSGSANPMMSMHRGGAVHADHALMMRMDSLGARLDSLVATMQRAKGQRKVDVMATVLAELVAGHREMQRHMHQQMMQQAGAPGGHGAGMMDCPMMRPGAPGTGGPEGAAVPPAHNH